MFGLGEKDDIDWSNPYSGDSFGEEKTQPSNPLRRVVADPLVGLAKGAAVGIPETVVGLLDIPTMGHAGKVAETVSRGLGLGDFKSANEMFNNLLTPETREAQQKVAEAKGFLPTIATAIQNPSSIVQTVAESIPAMVGGMRVAGAVSKLVGKPLIEAGVANIPRIATVGGAAEGAITAGQNIEQTRQQTEEGLLTPSQVAINTLSGVLTGMIGVAGGRLAQRFGLEDVDTLFTGGRSGIVGDKEKGIFKKILMGAFQEGVLEELPQSMQEQIAQNLALNKPIDDGVFEAGAMGMLAGFAQSTGANIAGSTMQKMKNELDPINQTIKKMSEENLAGELNAIGGWDNGKPVEAIPPTPPVAPPVAEPIVEQPVVEPIAPEPIVPETVAPAPVAPENVPASEQRVEVPAPVEKNFDPIKYAEHILQNNAFKDFELDSLMGKESKYKPHGLSPEIWKQAAENIGFNRNNLEKNKEGDYFLKSNITPTPALEKQPWEMTKSEHKEFMQDIKKYDQHLLNSDSERNDKIGKIQQRLREESNFKIPVSELEHKAEIIQALSEGKPVPESVLKDYPDLAKQVAGAPEVSRGGQQIYTQQQPGDIYSGKAYRVSTTNLGMDAKNALDKINFEADELGNKEEMTAAIKAAEKHGIDLSKLNPDDIVWVTRDKDVANKLYGYGEDIAEEQAVPKGSVVLSDIGEDGVLVLKGSAINKIKPPVTNQEQLKQRLAEGKRLAAEKRAEIASKPITPIPTKASTFAQFVREQGYNFPEEVEKKSGRPIDKFKELNKKLLKQNNTSYEQLMAVYKASKNIPAKEVPNETQTQTVLAKTKYGEIHPEDTWGGYNEGLNNTVRQTWKDKLEEYKNERTRVIQENGNKKIADNSPYSRENQVLLQRRLRDRRLLDAKIKESTSTGEVARWADRKISKNFGDTVEFQYADEHFSKLGFQVVPIDRVEWGGAVDQGTKVVFLGEMYGDRFAYFMAHETSHILSTQGDKSVQAIKDAVDLTNPIVVGQREGRDWTDDYTRDEFAAAIVGGADGIKVVLKSNQDENIKAVREAEIKTTILTKNRISYLDNLLEKAKAEGDAGRIRIEKLPTNEQQYLISKGAIFDVDRMGNPLLGYSQKQRVADLRNKVMNKTKNEKEKYGDLKPLDYISSYIPDSLSSWFKQTSTNSRPTDISQSNGTWETPTSSTMNTLNYVLADRNIDLRDVTKAIEKTHGILEDQKNASLKETLFSGRLSSRIDDFVNNELHAVTKAMAKNGVSLAQIEEYMHARHAEEANNYLDSLPEGERKGDAGISTEDANAYLQSLNPALKEKYEKIALMLDKITHKNAQLLVDYGLESQETIDKWFDKYKHYVPLFREDIEERPGIGQGFTVAGSASKGRTGSERKVVHILSNIAMQRERTLTRGEKNRVSQSLVSLAENFPNEDFWKVIKIPRLSTFISEGVETRIKPNVVVARVKDEKTGEIKHIGVQFNEKNERAARMAAALKNMDMDSMGEILGTLGKITRYVASINTQYNPVFGVTNFFRDMSTAALNLSTTPIAGKQKAVLSNVLPAMKGIWQAVQGNETSEMAKMFKDFQLHGGQTGYRNLFVASEDRAKDIEKELKSLQAGKPKRYLSAFAKVLSDYNTMAENSVRLSAYKVGIESGMTKDQAASMAKNLTVNFNKKGQIAGQAGALYAFFNASVQGAVRMYETLKGPMGRKIIAGGIILGATQAMMLAAAGFKDEEPPEFVKERNIIIPIGGKKYLTFPMPLGFNVIPNVGRILAEITLGGGKNAGIKMSNLIGVITETFNPLGSSGLSMQTVAPTFLDPFTALAENKDWTGRPIYKEDFNALSPTPGTSRVKDSATVFGRGLAWAFNILTGGDKYTPGMFSPTPDQIDYLGGQITGGLGREIGKTSMMFESLYTGNELPTYRLPLTGRFYGTAEGQANESNKYYSNLKKLNVHEANIKGRIKDREPIGEYLRDNPEAKLWKMANTIENNIGKIKKRKEMAKTSEAKKTYDKLITIQQKRLNDMMERVGG